MDCRKQCEALAAGGSDVVDHLHFTSANLAAPVLTNSFINFEFFYRQIYSKITDNDNDKV